MKLVLVNYRLPQNHAIVELSDHKRNKAYRNLTINGRKVWVTDRDYWVDSQKHKVHSKAMGDYVTYYVQVFEDYYYPTSVKSKKDLNPANVPQAVTLKALQVNGNPGLFKSEIEKLTLKLNY